MKKLNLIVVIAIASMFMLGAVVLAGENGGKKLNGEYVMLANGTCLHSTLGFNTNHTPITGPNSVVYAASTLAQAIWTFKTDGTGTVDGDNYVIDYPPGFPNQGPILRENHFAFGFTYEITGENEIFVTLPSGVVLEGMVSKDQKTLTLISTYQFFGASTVAAPGLCNTGRVLTRVE